MRGDDLLGMGLLTASEETGLRWRFRLGSDECPGRNRQLRPEFRDFSSLGGKGRVVLAPVFEKPVLLLGISFSRRIFQCLTDQ